jgi:hypothetical protein
MSRLACVYIPIIRFLLEPTIVSYTSRFIYLNGDHPDASVIYFLGALCSGGSKTLTAYRTNKHPLEICNLDKETPQVIATKSRAFSGPLQFISDGQRSRASRDSSRFLMEFDWLLLLLGEHSNF